MIGVFAHAAMTTSRSSCNDPRPIRHLKIWKLTTGFFAYVGKQRATSTPNANTNARLEMEFSKGLRCGHGETCKGARGRKRELEEMTRRIIKCI
jgi:hypothetical protein